MIAHTLVRRGQLFFYLFTGWTQAGWKQVSWSCMLLLNLFNSSSSNLAEKNKGEIHSLNFLNNHQRLSESRIALLVLVH